MSWNITNDRVTIFKNDKGTYKSSITAKDINENGEQINKYMNIHVGFRKGVEVKNKTKMKVNNAFLTFFNFKTGNIKDDGKEEILKFPKIMIMDFEVLEDGVDKNFHSKDYSQNDIENNEFYSQTDELPF